MKQQGEDPQHLENLEIPAEPSQAPEPSGPGEKCVGDEIDDERES